MKTIKNKQTQLPKAEGEWMTYGDLIKACLNTPPQGGFSIEDMRSRLNIFDICDKANGSLKFEDTQAELIKTVVKDYKWGIMHLDLVEFTDEVNKL